ncbi:hypothetical protein QVD17_41584 [Tagetes erecta]|uniref:Uncharacterized protein n=1 Tax=Tagetes erecta TaxID=13708 RepID=A0AAD8NFP0_TARER|nr:hypothetical protein QVD17_41584 [Tagetes erecta]
MSEFTSDLTSNLALVAEVYEEDWSEESDPRFDGAEEEYDWSDKSDPIVEIQTKEINHVEDVNLSVEFNKVEEVALVAQPKQIKVESLSFKSEKPPKNVPLPETVNVHYRSYSFRICNKLAKEEKSYH